MQGTVNSDSGTMVLMPLADKSYYPDGFTFRETKVVGGRFEFSGPISYPLEMRLILKINAQIASISDYFFADPGVQKIAFDTSSDRGIPHIANRSMNELNGEYIPWFSAQKL